MFAHTPFLNAESGRALTASHSTPRGGIGSDVDMGADSVSLVSSHSHLYPFDCQLQLREDGRRLSWWRTSAAPSSFLSALLTFFSLCILASRFLRAALHRYFS